MSDPFELDKDRNPCTYKKECKRCKAVPPEFRPERCTEIKCTDYTPCKKCSRNMELKDGFCKYCSPDGARTTITLPDGGTATIADLPPNHPLLKGYSPVQGNPSKITFPGTAPGNYSQEEKDYYNEQWQSYKGFYRDPSVYAIVHQIIMLEIELLHVGHQMMLKRGEVDKDLENKQQRLIENMKSLRNMLPAKDALDASRDEMMINNIYENYVNEIENRKVGGVARFISPDAIALCPYLEFPMDPIELGKKLGYRLADIVEVIDHLVKADDLPKEPLKMLEFFGFFLKQTYALQDSIPQPDSPVEEDSEGDFDEDNVAAIEDGGEPEEEKPSPPKMKAPPKTDDTMGFSVTAGDDE